MTPSPTQQKIDDWQRSRIRKIIEDGISDGVEPSGISHSVMYALEHLHWPVEGCMPWNDLMDSLKPEWPDAGWFKKPSERE